MPANSLKTSKPYRIPIENMNSLCSQTARKPQSIIESPLETRICYARKQLGSPKTLVGNANSVCPQTLRKQDNTIESTSKIGIRYDCKHLESQITL